jgi:hypothetical protein
MTRVVPLALSINGSLIPVGDAEVDDDGNLIAFLNDDWEYYRAGERVIIEGLVVTPVKSEPTKEPEARSETVVKKSVFHRRE